MGGLFLFYPLYCSHITIYSRLTTIVTIVLMMKNCDQSASANPTRDLPTAQTGKQMELFFSAELLQRIP